MRLESNATALILVARAGPGSGPGSEPEPVKQSDWR
jgi:hypothetical protein